MRFPPPSLFSIPRRGGLCTALLLSGCGPQVSEDSAVDTDRSTNSPDFIRVDENAATLEEWDYTIEEWQAQRRANRRMRSDLLWQEHYHQVLAQRTDLV